MENPLIWCPEMKHSVKSVAVEGNRGAVFDFFFFSVMVVSRVLCFGACQVALVIKNPPADAGN